jgi:hypothetical protein
MRITGTGGYPLLLKLLPLSVGGDQYIVLSDETDKKRGGNHECAREAGISKLGNPA